MGSRRFADVVDNGWLMLDFEAPQAPGEYYLEASAAQGKVGWWSTAKELVPDGQAYAGGVAVPGDRSLRIVPADDKNNQVRDFFTFRKPQPDYFAGPTGPEQWGWLGYDWIVNRRPLQDGKAIAEANLGGDYSWDSPVEVSLQVGENELELAVPREMLGLTAFPAVIDFKWADNIRQNGQWSDFTLNGDVAPNDRFNYRARIDTAN